MERGSNVSYFDGSDYAYWKTRMRSYLESQGSAVWSVVQSAQFVVLDVRISQAQVEEFEANSKARNILFSSLSHSEFDRVFDLTTTHAIWTRLQNFHEGTTQVKARLFDTYRREYENFRQLPGESVESMFSRFQGIVNKMRANGRLPYDDHERAIELLYSLDRKVWEVKVAAIIESPNCETLTVDELYSKVRSIEIDNETRAKYVNPSNPQISVTEEQVDAPGDEELALITKKSNCFYDNRRNRRRGTSKGCFECSDLNHFIIDCPKKKKKVEADKPNYKKKKYFDREALKKDFRKKFKAKERDFLASLSDFDVDSSDDDSSSSSEGRDNKKKKIIDNLNILCFMANDNSDAELDSEVQLSADELSVKVDELEDALVAQDRNLKCFILKQSNLDKFESRSSDSKFLGYALHSRAYRVLNLETNKIMEICEVTFDETIPCTTLAFETAGEQELSESIFVDEDFLALIVDDDDASFHPSLAAQELPSASTTSTEGPDATTASTFAAPLHDQAEAPAVVEGEATL
ncbi:uncharacterized protein LOC133890193 [Phragmites australis]|uniref:uncharacterized protein LOC133890193 n=1 Tax=Phragmites australis TaxID=29695 RepID=UPI002D79FF7E|nr:uncharacterized protein LOC133890193 [Phragmites australis]